MKPWEMVLALNFPHTALKQRDRVLLQRSHLVFCFFLVFIVCDLMAVMTINSDLLTFPVGGCNSSQLTQA